jgi:membrane associated rhomboid family serine protease
VTVALCLVLGVVGGLQGVLSMKGLDGVRPTAVGFERTLLDSGYWTPFSAALAHVGLTHLAVNLPLLAYCSYRTERLLGAWGAASVLATALLCSTVAILAWSDLPVVGASTLAYGAWGAQIALGIRYGRWIPAHLKGRYGIGNLVLFLPLAFVSLFNGPGVSLAGHAGGLAGGVVAVLIGSPFAPARASITTFLTLGLTAWLPWTPPAWWAGAWSSVAISDGAHLAMPSRWREHAGRWLSFPAWSSGDRYPVFAATFFASDEPEGRAIERERAVWSDWLHGQAVVTLRLAAQSAEGDVFDIRVDTSAEPWVIVERVQEHHGLRTRAGYVLPGDCGAPEACHGRRAIGDRVLSTLTVASSSQEK